MLKLKCTKHPRYNGTKSPKASCYQCIEIQKLRYTAQVAHITVVDPKGSNEPAEEPNG